MNTRLARLIACFFIAALGVTVLTGCGSKFTRERFELIKPGVDDAKEVQRLLGKPQYSALDVWHYESFDRHLSAQIYFGDDGRVMSKEWTGTR